MKVSDYAVTEVPLGRRDKQGELDLLREATQAVKARYDKQVQKLKEAREKNENLLGLLIELTQLLAEIHLEASNSRTPLPEGDLDALRDIKKKVEAVDGWIIEHIKVVRQFLEATLPDLLSGQ